MSHFWERLCSLVSRRWNGFLLRYPKLALALDRLSPFNWSVAKIKGVAVAVFAVMLPIYVFIGLQPAEVDAAGLPVMTISSIGLDTPVKQSQVIERNIEVPDKIAGEYSQSDNKTLIVGHSTTVFKNLQSVNERDIVQFNGENYVVTKTELLLKADVDMSAVLRRADEPTIIIMTCAGEITPDLDATHRFLVTAVKI